MHSLTFSLEPPDHTTGGARMILTVKSEMIQSVEDARNAGEQAALMCSAFLDGYGEADLDSIFGDNS